MDAVQFIWTGPIGNAIVNNARKTILRKYQHQNNFSSEVLFEYRTEEDKGMYTCTVAILDVRVSASLYVAPWISKFLRKWYIRCIAVNLGYNAVFVSGFWECNIIYLLKVTTNQL